MAIWSPRKEYTEYAILTLLNGGNISPDLDALLEREGFSRKVFDSKTYIYDRVMVKYSVNLTRESVSTRIVLSHQENTSDGLNSVYQKLEEMCKGVQESNPKKIGLQIRLNKI